jgi:hypothetical protein
MADKISSGRKLLSSGKMADRISSGGKWLSSERWMNILAKRLSTIERMSSL